MAEVKSFLSDLDEAVARGTAESRERALWHATDLLIAGRYSDDEIWTFGEVIGRLADEIEVAARAQLSKRLASFDNAPINIIHKLAFDDSIDVAGPVLRESEQLDDNALIANATTKSQSHLLAISPKIHRRDGHRRAGGARRSERREFGCKQCRGALFGLRLSAHGQAR